MRRMLVVEDVPGDQTAQILQVAGAFGVVVSVRQDASSIALSQIVLFDHVLIDLKDRGESAMELLRRLDPHRHCPNVILLSRGDNSLIARIGSLASVVGVGPLSVIINPADPEELRIGLERAFSVPLTPTSGEARRQSAVHITDMELDAGLLRNEFEVVLQPQVSLADGRWIGVEALARWRHPAHGTLAPGSFLHFLGRRGTSLAFTEHIVQRAVEAYAELRSLTKFDGTLSVNVPPAVLGNESFPDRVCRSLAESRLDESALLIELNTAAFAREMPVVLGWIGRRGPQGMGFSLDDFASVEVRVERFAKLRIAEMKIDAACAANAWRDAACGEFVERAVRAARSRGARIVAKNVENGRMLDYVRNAGCDAVQGNFVSPPMRVAAFDTWCATWPRRWRETSVRRRETSVRRAAPVPDHEARAVTGSPAVSMSERAMPQEAPASPRALTGRREGPAVTGEKPAIRDRKTGPGSAVRPRLLVVEDNAMNRELFARYLATHGFSVETAGDGQSGVEKALRGGYGVVVMDIQMPGLDGVSAIRAIRDHRPSEALPILAISALGALFEDERCFEAGANAYMPKPFHLQELLHRVRELSAA